MKLAVEQTDSNTVELTIHSTGKPGDDQMIHDVTHLPYVGPYRINWGDGSSLQVVPQPIDDVGPPATSADDPTVVTHDYSQKGSFRGYVEGDARIRFHALSS
jgi:hypothetical protein